MASREEQLKKLRERNKLTRAKLKSKKSRPRIQPIEDAQLVKLGAVCVLSVALNKSLSRGASYWVDLYFHEHNNIKFWYVVRKWRFPKDGEVVYGEKVHQKATNLNIALELLKKMSEEKIEEAGYCAHNIAVTRDVLEPDEEVILNKAFAEEGWEDVDVDEVGAPIHNKPGEAVSAVAVPPEPKQRPEPKKKPLDAAMEKRKKKGFWT